MATIYYDKNASSWKEKCGCAGGDKVFSPTSQVFLKFNVSANGFVKGLSNKNYFVRPNMIALDVIDTDAVEFIKNREAKIVTSAEWTLYQGYRAIQS